MRKIYASLVLLLGLCSLASAQFTVTFQVDMNTQASIADTVSVAGNFQVAAGFPSDWTPGATRLTDTDQDGIYTLDVTLPAGTYEYKFLNGAAWGTDESVPGSCATSNNRSMTISANTVLPVVCFGACAACPTTVDTVTVTFQVDMSNETVGSDVTVAGNFQAAAGFGSDWTPGTTVLTDPDLDGIYTITVDLPEGTYQYKYLNGTAWGSDESVPSGCAVSNNREVVIAGPGPMIIPLHCYASCDTCVPPLPPINVTFRVDMSNEIVSSTGIFVAGSFQNPAWVKDTLQMLDPDMNGVYEYTQSLVPAEYQYKYYNGDGGDPDGENADFEAAGCGVNNGLGSFNRLLDLTGRLTDSILPIYEYNSCNTVAASVKDEVFATLNVYPNPFNQNAIVELKRETRTAYALRIVSITGQVMQVREGLRADRIEISRQGLQSGLYFIELKDTAGRKVTQKIVIQ